jgi:hypothetical protein
MYRIAFGGAPKSQSHANLLRSLADVIRGHAVDANGRQNQGHQSQNVEQDKGNPGSRRDISHDFRHGSDFEYRLVPVHGPDRTANFGKNRVLRERRTHDHAHGLVRPLYERPDPASMDPDKVNWPRRWAV